MTDDDLHWMAGLLEGEGSFYQGPPSRRAYVKVSVEMTDRDVIERVAALWGMAWRSPKNRNPAAWKQSYQTVIQGKKAEALMRQLYPLMGERRRKQIDVALLAAITTPRWGTSDEKVRRVRARVAAGERSALVAEDEGVSYNTVRSWVTGARGRRRNLNDG